MYRVIIYNLSSDKSGKTILSYSLNGNIISNDLQTLVLKLNDKVITLQKAKWLNKVFDDGKTFFIMATKYTRTEWVFDKLMEYAIKKIDNRSLRIASTRQKLVNELNEHRLQVA